MELETVVEWIGQLGNRELYALVKLVQEEIEARRPLTESERREGKKLLAQEGSIQQ